MEHENIDWSKIESIFEEDDFYENINAPKWIDLSAPCQTIDDEAWFCKPGCKHPNCAEDYLKSKHYSKVKLLRPITISEILPFRTRREAKAKNGEKGSKPAQSLNEDNENRNPNLSTLPLGAKTMPLGAITISEILPFRTRREAKAKNGEKGSKPAQSLNEDNENRNPNLSTLPLGAKTMPKKLGKKSSMEEKTKLDDLRDSSGESDRGSLKSTFSARNLVAGREILSQITEFCSELKRMVKKGSKKGVSEKASDGILGVLKERVRERERAPLLVVKEREV